MRYILFIIFSTIGINNTIGQQVNYKITYRHCVKFDTTKISTDTLGVQAILFGNAKESNYVFLKGNAVEQAISQKSFEDVIKDKVAGTFTTQTSSAKDSLGNMVYTDKDKNLTLVREKMPNEYVITKEKSPKINWDIKEEFKKINNYTCQKAITTFRGRKYTAWFTTDIAIVAAPWKFYGLPGLLMLIEDEKQVKIIVEKIEYPVTDKVPAFVNIGTEITLEKYFSYREQEHKKQTQAMQAVLDNQPYMSEIIKRGGKRPTVTSDFVLAGIEKQF